MQIMTTAATAPVLADGGLSDGRDLAAFGVAALSGGAVVRLIELLAGRKKANVDTAQVAVDAMKEVMTSAVELLRPQTEQIEAIQDRHRVDMQALREEHAAAMTRVQSEHGAAMQRLGARIETLEVELRDVRTENAELKGRLTSSSTAEHPLVVNNVNPVDGADAR